MYYVYVLQSEKNFKKYVGYTQKLPEVRLIEHNSGSNQWTRQNGPFVLLYSESFSSRRVAIQQEKYFKSAAGRIALKKILENERS